MSNRDMLMEELFRRAILHEDDDLNSLRDHLEEKFEKEGDLVHDDLFAWAYCEIERLKDLVEKQFAKGLRIGAALVDEEHKLMKEKEA